MPLHDYICETCGDELKDHLHRIDEHPKCCGKPMKKQPAVPAPVHSSAGDWRKK